MSSAHLTLTLATATITLEYADKPTQTINKILFLDDVEWVTEQFKEVNQATKVTYTVKAYNAHQPKE